MRDVVGSRGGRCPRCYGERLGRAAARAAALGIEAFTTTLLASRHQDHEAVIAAGEEAGAAAGVAFLSQDLRALDAESHRRAREMGLYLQGYCGCIYSEEERYRKRKGATARST